MATDPILEIERLWAEIRRLKVDLGNQLRPGAGGGGWRKSAGGGSELANVTVVRPESNIPLAGGAKIINDLVLPAGLYLISAQATVYAYDGENGGGRIWVVDDQAQLIGEAYSCMAIPDAGQRQTLAIVPVTYQPVAQRTVSFYGEGSFLNAYGSASGVMGTWLALIGPITI